MDGKGRYEERKSALRNLCRERESLRLFLGVDGLAPPLLGPRPACGPAWARAFPHVEATRSKWLCPALAQGGLNEISLLLTLSPDLRDPSPGKFCTGPAGYGLLQGIILASLAIHQGLPRTSLTDPRLQANHFIV